MNDTERAAARVPRTMRNADAIQCMNAGVPPGYYDCPTWQQCGACNTRWLGEQGDLCPHCKEEKK